MQQTMQVIDKNTSYRQKCKLSKLMKIIKKLKCKLSIKTIKLSEKAKKKNTSNREEMQSIESNVHYRKNMQIIDKKMQVF